MATGTASAPGMTAPAKVADFQIYYKDQRLEGVAGYNKGGKGAPVELYDVLHCKGKGKARKCVLVDYDGSTIASSKTTVVTGTQHRIKATRLVKVPKFYTEGAIPGQVSTVVYPAGEQANGSGQVANSNSATNTQPGAPTNTA